MLEENSPVSAEPRLSWSAWVKQLREEGISQGIRAVVFDEAFSTVKAQSRQVLHLDRT